MKLVSLFNTHVFIPVWCIAVAMGLATAVVNDPAWHRNLWNAAGRLCFTAMAFWLSLTGFGMVWATFEALARRTRSSLLGLVFAALVLGLGIEFAYFGVRFFARLMSLQ